jgi:hypothetical protein
MAMITRTAKIKAMSNCASGKPPRFAFLLDSGFVIKMHPDTLKQWVPATFSIGALIAYDVDESTGALLNPRPAPHGIVSGEASPMPGLLGAIESDLLKSPSTGT